MKTSIKVILGIIIVIVGFLALSATAYYTTSDEDRARWEAEEERRNALPQDVFDIIPSKMGNGYWQSDAENEYYEHSEKLLEDYILNYKGKDNSGWTMEEMLLVELAEDCGAKMYTDSYGFVVESGISDWEENQIETERLKALKAFKKDNKV